MFNIVSESRLTTGDFSKKIEYLIDGFIALKMITMFYAEGGSGKSWLAYAIAKFAARQGMRVIYLDYDNPLNVLAERGLESKLIIPHADNLYYVSSSKSDLTSNQMIDEILRGATPNNMDNAMIIIDSLRDFCDVRNDNQAMSFMKELKMLRDLGATPVVLSHSNKDSRNYEGSNNIYNSVDNMFRVNKIEEELGRIKYLFTTRKDRAGNGDSAINLSTETLNMMFIDVEEAKLSTEEKDFIEAVKAVLTETPGLNKKELLDALGHDKRDKTANARLDRYTGQHWQSTKKSNVYTYQLSEQS